MTTDKLARDNNDIYQQDYVVKIPYSELEKSAMNQ